MEDYEKLAYVLFCMLNALANLFGIGGGSLISRLLGIHKTEDAKAVSSFGIYGTIPVTFHLQADTPETRPCTAHRTG